MTKLVFLFVMLTTFGISKKAVAGDNPARPQTLDFEGEIIEGEAMRPDLFLQISTPDVNLDSIIYMRKDFNDFHKIDKIQKPKYVPDKK